jgi:hypothetical protein
VLYGGYAPALSRARKNLALASPGYRSFNPMRLDARGDHPMIFAYILDPRENREALDVEITTGFATIQAFSKNHRGSATGVAGLALARRHSRSRSHPLARYTRADGKPFEQGSVISRLAGAAVHRSGLSIISNAVSSTSWKNTLPS